MSYSSGSLVLSRLFRRFTAAGTTIPSLRILQAFYGNDNATEGDVLIAQGIVNDTVAAGGILTLADMRGYKPVWRDPLQLDAMGLTIFVRGFPGQPPAIHPTSTSAMHLTAGLSLSAKA